MDNLHDSNKSMTQTEALKLALEALKRATNYDPVIARAITAIKEVLAQPEQERCVGCEACIDTACGRDECPKGWPKAAQPEQEPVAHFGSAYVNENGVHITTVLGPVAIPQDAKLYTTPPQRTWVGLTKEDMDWLHANTPCIEGNYGYRFIKFIEAKIKEKNT